MISLLSRLFTSKESIDSVMNAAISAGDKIVFTKEEKAEMNLKLQDWYIKYLEATKPMNLARRVIAVTVTGLWTFHLSLGTTLRLAGFKEQSEEIFKIMSDHIDTPFSVIMAFYFIAHIAGKMGNNSR